MAQAARKLIEADNIASSGLIYEPFPCLSSIRFYLLWRHPIQYERWICHLRRRLPKEPVCRVRPNTGLTENRLWPAVNNRAATHAVN